VICNPPPLDFKPRSWPQRVLYGYQLISLLLLYFFITFFFPSTMTPHHEQLALCTIVLNGERRVTPLLLTILIIFVLPSLTFVFRIIAPFFLGRSNEMAMAFWHQVLADM
jgi:hypothetical protein